jgi:hypothetical protein
MTLVERELHRAAVKNKKERLSGIHNEVCLGCGCDLAQGKEDDHMIGRKHGDLVWPLCLPCPARGASADRKTPQRVRGDRSLALVGRRIF